MGNAVIRKYRKYNKYAVEKTRGIITGKEMNSDSMKEWREKTQTRLFDNIDDYEFDNKLTQAIHLLEKMKEEKYEEEYDFSYKISF